MRLSHARTFTTDDQDAAMNTKRLRTIAYWLATIFGPASFVIGGMLHLARTPDVMATLQHLGYPAYFAWILGTGKLAGAVVVVAPRLPRLKEWAYAGFAFDLIAAAASRAFVGDGAGDILAPIGFLILVLASWALRPASRRLADPVLSHSLAEERAASVATA
jgi:uncharacterized membrane protein YphA (DoxX/SURF4 family)